MNKKSYGDMNKFIEELKTEGFSDAQMIDTANGKFMSRKEAVLLGLTGSTLLVGRK